MKYHDSAGECVSFLLLSNIKHIMSQTTKVKLVILCENVGKDNVPDD
jgi:hypothetical protein